MPWQMKAGAPASFNLASAFAALVAGDTEWEWLLGDAPLLGPTGFQTAAFCAMGPPLASEVDLSVFLDVPGRNPIEVAQNLLARLSVLRALAYQRIFLAYCETAADPHVCAEGATYHCVGSTGGNYNVVQADPVPGSPAFVEFSVANYVGGGGHIGVKVGGRATSTGPVIVDSVIDINVSANGRYSGAWAWPSSCHYYYLNSNNSVGDVTMWWCGPQAGGDPPPDIAHDAPEGFVPAPAGVYPDTAALGVELDRQETKLDRLIDLLQYVAYNVPEGGPAAASTEVQAVAEAVAQLPGGSAPIHLVDGPTLTGYGEIAVPAGSVGAVLEVTQAPGGERQGLGPLQYIGDCGFVAAGDDNGWRPQARVQHSGFLLELPHGTTRLAWSLSSNVSVGVTWLVR